MKEKLCFNCKFFATQDQGYSNYTVTDTEVHCLKNLNPNFPMEESYSWRNKSLKGESEYSPIVRIAENCQGFKECAENEEQIGFDVEGEITIEDYKNDIELYSIAKEYFNHE